MYQVTRVLKQRTARRHSVDEVTRVTKQRMARHRSVDEFEVAPARYEIPALQRGMELAFEDTPPQAFAIRREFFQAAPGVTRTWFSPGVVKKPAVYDIVRRTTLSGLALDNGLPYPTDLETYGLAVVEQLPEYRGDPDKLDRAAAFAGWAFVEQFQEGQVQRIVRLLSERREKRRAR